MPYVADGEYHDRRRCRRLHRTSDRITRTEDVLGLAPCDRCVEEPYTYEEEMHDGDKAQLIQAGICPWCPKDDRYEGDHVGRHASAAHPEAWDRYQQ